MKEQDIRKTVRQGYAEIAKQNSSCCGGGKNVIKKSSCGCVAGKNAAEMISSKIGYSDTDMSSVPDGANLGLGCGNPVALASLKPGEIVLDLGSGAGFDCFLASPRVGKEGKVIGVDMTFEMLDKARENARKGKYQNVEFRLGEIENLPVADNSIDVIISNCVINLSTDKKRVFQEANRVLKPSGRLMISDIVLLKELPADIIESAAAYVGCISGAMLKEAYINTIRMAGFKTIKIVEETKFPIDCVTNDPLAATLLEDLDISSDLVKEAADSVVSIKVTAQK